MTVSFLQPSLPQSPSTPFRWGQFRGASFAFALAQAAQQNDTVFCVPIANPRELQILHAELKHYLGDLADSLLHWFPDWETLAYDHFSPHEEIISNRLRLMARLPDLSKGIVLCSTYTLLQRLPPQRFIQAHSFNLSTGECINIEALRLRLQHVGYYAVNQVLSQGEFAFRGGIIDIFPMGFSSPFRLDLFDDEIESIRLFNPETQKSIETIDTFNLLPAREFPLTEEGIGQFRQNFRSQFAGDPSTQTVYADVTQGKPSAGVEYYLPLFFSETVHFLDYLPEQTQLLLEHEHQSHVATIWAETQDRYQARASDITRRILPPDAILLNQSEYSETLKPFLRLTHGHEDDKNVNWRPISHFPNEYLVDSKSEAPYQALATHLLESDKPVLIAVETAGRREALESVLTEYKVRLEQVESWKQFLDAEPRFAIIVSPLDRGLTVETPGVQMIVESQLYGELVFQRRQRKTRKAHDPEAIIRSLAELQLGAPVVHIDHGVGRYMGLQVLNYNDIEEEFLTLHYRGEDKLFVPIQSLELISRFVGGDPELAPLHKLGSPVWDKAKEKAKLKSYDVATELLEVEAARQARKGISFNLEKADYQAFCARFPYEETADQRNAIEDVIADLRSSAPMDRLICGDVGFGKTEVSLRAAFMAVSNGKQVILLVPTTLLAQQHFESFRDRFADTGYNVALLSRFTSQKQTKETLAHCISGQADIVIGTHRLIQDDIRFKDLGLLMIDEEHRFGVRQKEKIKRLRNEVDILTLTATPIPRTLNMTMAGLRDISIIATAPQLRLAIKTFVIEENKGIVREACLREINRGGQMYFLHNEVKTIQRTAEDLQELIPEARVGFAHGQMTESQLESVMRDFYHQKFNVLVATTIIESGIDIPSANTIIINRADRFGLAQLHQLRGRVGRSHHQAFAYLIAPNRKSLTGDAKKRLDAIASLEELGAGFSLASHDLEIRGAGELLGETQSGLIDDVGFTLYSDYLNRAIDALRASNGDTPVHGLETPTIEVTMGVPALFPDNYLGDVHLRLVMYKRIASAKSADELREMEIECIDRFGLLPDPGKHLFRSARIKLAAKDFGIRKIDADEDGGSIYFIDKPPVDISKLIILVQREPHVYKLTGANELQFDLELEKDEARYQHIERLLQHFSSE